MIPAKNSTLISREKLLIFFGWKTRENVVVLDFLAIDNFDFTRKIVKKNFGWKTRENVEVLSKLNFWTKIGLFEQCVVISPLLILPSETKRICNRKLHLSQLFLALFFDLPHSFFNLEFSDLSLVFRRSMTSNSWAYFVFFQYDFSSPYRLSIFPFSAFLRRQRPSLLLPSFSTKLQYFVVFSGHFFLELETCWL